ncbi:MAG: extracellular solute-binding protein [Chloroflexota bacterium]|nr:extracellular solute-binding protein [Chloroflexota bacterium]
MNSRREFLKCALGGSVVLLAAACGQTSQPASAPAAQPTTPPAAGATSAPPAAAKPTEGTAAKPAAAPANISGATVSLLQWNHFIPTADPFFKQQAEDWGRQNGVNITVETINGNDLVPRFTAALQGQSGPTIFQMQHLQAHTFAEGLQDLTDLANEVESKFGKFYEQVKSSGLVEGKYRGVPYNIVGNAFVYRKSMFDKAGVTVPNTWDEFRESAKKLKASGKPVGQTYGQTFGDAPTFFYPLMWAFGGKELQEDGKTIAINSKETIDAVKFAADLWKEGLDERGLSWDDNNNNAAFLAEEISCTLNGASIFFVGAGLDGKTPPKPWADDMDHFLPPRGTAGQFAWFLAFTHGIPSYVKGKDSDASKAFLRYIYEPAQYDAWFEQNKGYSVGPGDRLESHKMWNELPKALAPFRTAGKIARALGYAGPPSPKVQESLSKYIVVNMFARAVQGVSPEDSVRQAETEMKQIFG